MNKQDRIKELLQYYEYSLEELTEIASKITRENFSNKAELCSILSVKTGKCSEDCRYCSQSGHYKTKIEVHELLSVEEVKKAAENSKENMASRFCIVTSGKNPDDKDFTKILNMVETVADIEGLHCCASLGILDEKRVKQLKSAGLERYNHNLNTCKDFYKEISSTHTYEDRFNTIENIIQNDIEVCSGGIIGMGESREQRIALALELAELNPVSVPINILHPVEGTPFENRLGAIDEEEILKTLAIFRIALPKAYLRYAGGRTTRLSESAQKLGIKLGVNALLVGNYLTTTGTSPDNDLKMLSENDLIPV